MGFVVSFSDEIYCTVWPFVVCAPWHVWSIWQQGWIIDRSGTPITHSQASHTVVFFVASSRKLLIHIRMSMTMFGQAISLTGVTEHKTRVGIFLAHNLLQQANANGVWGIWSEKLSCPTQLRWWVCCVFVTHCAQDWLSVPTLGSQNEAQRHTGIGHPTIWANAALLDQRFSQT